MLCLTREKNRGSPKPVSHLLSSCCATFCTWSVAHGWSLIVMLYFFTNHISSFIPFFFPLSNVFEASASTDWSRAAEDCILQNLWLNNLVLCLSTVVVTAYRRCNWFWKVAWICRNETIALVLVHRKSTLLKSSTAWSHCCSCSGVRESQRTYEQWFLNTCFSNWCPFWTVLGTGSAGNRTGVAAHRQTLGVPHFPKPYEGALSSSQPSRSTLTDSLALTDLRAVSWV